MGWSSGHKITSDRLNSMGRLLGQTTWTSDSSTFTTSAVMLKTLTASVPSSPTQTYVIVLDAGFTNSTLATMRWQFYAAGGASVTTSSTRNYSRKMRHHTAGSFDHIHIFTQSFVVTPSGGQISVGVSGLNDGGTGKFLGDADNIGLLQLYAVDFSG